ncbi:MAG: hypothetical protein QM662_06430, partial [Gordonia sp. (in: high G+C Gram-positive bacteria)]
LAVRLATAGPVPLTARLAARTATGAAPRMVQHSGGLLILPRVDTEVTIVAVPEAGHTAFAQGTVLHVSFGPDSTDDPSTDIAQLTPRDVSGMSFIELASVAPGAGATITVQTRLAVPDAPLPPLAAKARVACRSVLRTDQIPESEALRIRCVVDTSASMAALFDHRVVAACGEVVAGIAAVIGDGPTVEYTPAGGAPVPIPLADLGETLLAAPAAGYGLGADLPAAIGAAGAARTLTVVVTDGPGSVTGATPTATLLVSPSRRAAERAGFTGAWFPPPPADVDPRAALVDDPAALSALVDGLVRPARIGDVTR